MFDDQQRPETAGPRPAGGPTASRRAALSPWVRWGVACSLLACLSPGCSPPEPKAPPGHEPGDEKLRAAPSVIDLTEGLARKEVEDVSGLVLVVEKRTEAAPERPGRVVSQQPQPGTMVRGGAKITVVIVEKTPDISGAPRDPTHPAGAARGVLGDWDSDWGPMTFEGSNEKLTGFWIQGPNKRGEITDGKFDPQTRQLTFSYFQSWNMAKGQLGVSELTLSEDGNSMVGRWKNDPASASWGGWQLTRKPEPGK